MSKRCNRIMRWLGNNYNRYDMWLHNYDVIYNLETEPAFYRACEAMRACAESDIDARDYAIFRSPDVVERYLKIRHDVVVLSTMEPFLWVDDVEQ